MSAALTLDGIDHAISNLGYRSARSPKARLIRAVRTYYANPASIGTLQEIAPEALIAILWGKPGSAAELRSRRKNLASVRSSVNADFKNLFDAGRNPEGISIGSNFVFAMSEDAKERLLSSLTQALQPGQSVSLVRIAELLAAAGQYLQEMDVQGSEKSANDLEELKTAISRLAGLAGPGGFSPPAADASSTGGDELGEVIETDACDEILAVVEPDAPEEIVEIAEEDGLLSPAAVSAQFPFADGPDAPAAQGQPWETGSQHNAPQICATGGPEPVDGPAAVPQSSSGTAPGSPEGSGKDAPADFPGHSQSPNGIEIGLPLDALDEMGDDIPFDPEDLRSRKLLAEKFDGFLGVMERYYNQYLLIAEKNYVVGSQNPLKGELKAQEVQLPAFYMGKFPVTNALFEVFVDRTGYVTTAERRGEATVYRARFQKAVDPQSGRIKSVWQAFHRRDVVKGACWYQPFGPGSGLHAKRNHPVVQVSLQDALAFAAWTGKRLPRELEWEAAARGGGGFLLPWGDGWLDERCNTEETGIGDTTAVDRYPTGASALGICDCLGNVLEWTTDVAPPVVEGETQPAAVIAKGGSWISDKSVRLHSRFRVSADFCANILGFRCLAE
ncbi:MAG TPA: SUMF1/EgtB/PvdO family nonheme iron enzyme [Desulfobacterales bacterium]|nr:SUMF1/EgtB/PvdO family nonheme iron enzyme [Desulfobacterales bacterium]